MSRYFPLFPNSLPLRPFPIMSELRTSVLDAQYPITTLIQHDVHRQTDNLNKTMKIRLKGIFQLG